MKNFSFSKNRKKIFLIFIFLFFFLVTQSDYVMFDIPEKIDSKIYQLSEIDNVVDLVIGGYRHRLFKLYDELNVFRISHNKHSKKLPLFEFKLSPDDMLYLEEAMEESRKLGYRSDFANEWRSVSMIHNETKYNVKIKLHGNSVLNFNPDKFSFNIKTDSNNYFQTSRNLQFILPEEAGYDANLFLNDLAREIGLRPLKTELARVSINGRYKGIYLVSEKIDSRYLEKNKQTDRKIVSIGQDNWRFTLEDLQNNIRGRPSPHAQKYLYEEGLIEEIEDVNNAAILAKYSEFLSVIENENSDGIVDYVDVDEWGRYEAWRTIRGDIHQALGDNLRISYSVVTGLFYPVPRVEDNVNKLKQEWDISFEYELNAYGERQKFYSKLINTIDRNEIIRNKRNFYLQKIVDNSEYFVNQYKLTNEQYRKALIKDFSVKSSREIDYDIRTSYDNFIHNIKLVENQLKRSRLYINIIENRDDVLIEIVPESNSAIIFKQFNLNFENYSKNINPIIHEELFQFDLDEEMKVKIKKINLTVKKESNASLVSYDLEALNNITKDVIPKENVKVAYMKNSSQSFDANLLNDIFNFESYNDKIVIGNGIYNVTNTLIFPNKPVIIQAGAKIYMSKDTSILFSNDLHINGTSSNPVIVTSNETFGTFAVVSANKKSSVNIKHLDLSKGGETFVDGKFFSGGIAVYNSDVNISNSVIHSNKGDDGANFKNGRVNIINVTFKNNFADQIDLDFCQAFVQNSNFLDNFGDANGDGLDLSGSTAILTDNLFFGFSDKAISVGERTNVIVINNRIENSNIGIAVKDLSEVFFHNNSLKNNNNSIVSYMKKPIFGGGKTYITSSEIHKYSSKKIDSLSKIYSVEDSFIHANNMSDIDNVDLILSKSSSSTIEKLIIHDKIEYSNFYTINYFVTNSTLTGTQNLRLNFTGSENIKSIFFDTKSGLLKDENEYYYLKIIAGNDNIELFYLRPFKNKTYYELKNTLSSDKKLIHAIEYAVGSKKNEQLKIMKNDLDLNDKLNIVKTNSHIVNKYVFESLACEQPIMLEEFKVNTSSLVNKNVVAIKSFSNCFLNSELGPLFENQFYLGEIIE
ncbi:hypothetical protein BVX95_00665 [archaeon D22]|nr:hypothetical protein BVX95_00665 [archaeon D22]